MPSPSSSPDAVYSPSRLVPGFGAILAEYRRASDAAKRECSCRLGLRYGAKEGERLHHFPAPRERAPLLVYIHGGHWQELGIDDSCFPAPGLVARGAGFVALGYPLAPAASLDAIVASVARGLEWVAGNATELGAHPERIYLAGSSAGAHLAAMALASGPAAAPVDLAGAALLSGVYDLDGIRRSYVNDALRLDEAAARRNSPLFQLPLRVRRVLVARGELETDEYGRQQDEMAAALRLSQGPAAVEALVCGGRNHFDLPLGIGDDGDQLGRAVFAQMGLAPVAG